MRCAVMTEGVVSITSLLCRYVMDLEVTCRWGISQIHGSSGDLLQVHRHVIDHEVAIVAWHPELVMLMSSEVCGVAGSCLRVRVVPELWRDETLNAGTAATSATLVLAWSIDKNNISQRMLHSG